MIPVLNIEQFENKERLIDVYSNQFGNHVSTNKDIVHTAHRHDFFLCVLFTKGTGMHEIDFNSYRIGPGSVFFLKPGQTHLWSFESEPDGFIFFHTRDFFEFVFSNIKLTQFPFYFSNENPPYLELKMDELESIRSRFKELNDEYYKSGTYWMQKMTGLIHLLYVDLARLYTISGSHKIIGSTTYLNTLRNMEVLVQEYYREEKSVQFYADKLNITSKHLNRIAKYTIGKTASEIISERVILEAKRLLVHTGDSLTDIGFLLGYEDYAYFSRMFKLKTGSLPSNFRNRYKA